MIPTPAANLQKKWAKFNNLLLLWYLQQAAHGDSNARSKSTKENGKSLIICLLLWYLQLTAHLVIATPAANLQKKLAKFDNLLLLWYLQLTALYLVVPTTAAILEKKIGDSIARSEFTKAVMSHTLAYTLQKVLSK